jgi:hypothetical protein
LARLAHIESPGGSCFGIGLNGIFGWHRHSLLLPEWKSERCRHRQECLCLHVCDAALAVLRSGLGAAFCGQLWTFPSCGHSA